MKKNKDILSIKTVKIETDPGVEDTRTDKLTDT